MISPPPDENDHLNHLASVRMESGIALLNDGAPEALLEALRCFDEAIELRRRLPVAENPGFRFGLAAGWINRGDALTRMGGTENLVGAVNSYTAAIELLKNPPAGDDGSFTRRLAIAWMNRGIALEHQKDEHALIEAVYSYKEAIRVLSGLPRADGELDLVLASAWINLGNASLRSPGGPLAAEARKATEQALSLLAAHESKVLAAAEAGLVARHILCQAITTVLAETCDDASIDLDLINELTDAVEGALSLAQSWEKAGVTHFRPLATQFFRLGALTYEKHQSHFLAEFLREHLEPDSSPVSATWLAIAEESLSRVRDGLRSYDFASLATPEGIRRLEILNEVRATEERFQALRS
jgi:tetratricopeptide (TPR) repeat protein